MTDSNGGRPRVLIEDWLPVAELGAESQRERAAVHALPPLSFLHVWWARRPLVASAAVVLGSLLPAWSQSLAGQFPDDRELQSEKAYQKWLLHLVGIWGDPLVARRAYDAAVAAGQRIPNPYTYKQAYRNAIPRADIDLLHAVLRTTWGELPLVLDPTAGGGSIPFAASRLGIPVAANDLNGVAASLLRAGVEIPARSGSKIVGELQRWGEVLVARVDARVARYFPSGEAEQVATYLFANAVLCPRTGRLVPLLTDLWLRKQPGKECAVRLVLDDGGVPLSEPRFEVLTGRAVEPAAAGKGTVKRGNAISPYDGLVIDGDYIKAEAQAGRMGSILYAVVAEDSRGEKFFREPTDADRDALRAAANDFSGLRGEWEKEGFIPVESVPEGLKTSEPLRYGIRTWQDMFTARQLLVHGWFSAEFAALIPEIRDSLGDAADDVLFELALIQGKAVDYNTRLAHWDPIRTVMVHMYARHDYAFKWTFAEFEGTALYRWALSQILKVYPKISALLADSGDSGLGDAQPLNRSVSVTQGSAASLSGIDDGEVTCVCIDPPYYDNVMYAELSDFFYVWERRTLGRLDPGLFPDGLADKDNEAVANSSRFSAMGKRKKELADLDYESKMTAIFAECRRVLTDFGVLTVMFTHKRAEAWDTLGMGLLQAGFTIETSWPVNTESATSTHQKNQNSAASTVMLVCRKRVQSTQSRTFLDDIEAEVRKTTRDAAARFRDYGIGGVDLLLSTYGPAMSVISEHWPVYSSVADLDGRARLLRPEEALAIAREEVVKLQRQRIIGRDTQIDNHADFVMIAWETFKSPSFSFDEARRLALSVGALELDELAQAKVLEKKSGSVRLLPPKERIRRGGDDASTGVRIDAARFEYMNDALDTVLYVAEVDGMSVAKALMDRLGLTADQRFLAYVQGLVNAMPREKAKGEWVVPEAGLLDTLVTAYLPDITLPAEPEIVAGVEEAPTLFD